VDEVVDLRSLGALDRFLDGATALFHLAGVADVGKSIADPLADFEANVLTSVHALEAARRAKSLFVFPSSASVYDGAGPMPCRETSALGPRSPYGAGKLAVEGYCRVYHLAYGLDARVARLFSVYGPGMRRFAIHDFVERLERAPNELVIRGDGGQTRDLIYAEDAVRALLLIAEKGRAGEIYNVASGEPRTMLQVARAVAAAMGLRDARVTPDGRNHPGELYRMEADVAKLAALGFRSETSFADGLKRTVAWLRENRNASS
jgi:UDP-glucose 4-epimerase